MTLLRHVGSPAFVRGLFTAAFVGLPWHVMVAEDPAAPWWLKAAVFCLLGGILVLLLTLALEQKRRTTAVDRVMPPRQDRSLLLLNSDVLPGRKIERILGLVH